MTNKTNTEFFQSLRQIKTSVVVDILMGHTSLSYHLNKLGVVNGGLELDAAEHFTGTYFVLGFYLTLDEQLQLDLASLLS